MGTAREIRVATAKAFYPPSDKLKKIGADDFLANGGDIARKYIWTKEGKLLGMAYEAILENDNSYCIIFAEQFNASSRMCLNSNFINVGF